MKSGAGKKSIFDSDCAANAMCCNERKILFAFLRTGLNAFSGNWFEIKTIFFIMKTIIPIGSIFRQLYNFSSTLKMWPNNTYQASESANEYQNNLIKFRFVFYHNIDNSAHPLW